MLPPSEDIPPPPPAVAAPVPPPPTLSPDGAYQWNGFQWIPRSYVPSTPYRSARTRAKWVVSLFGLLAITIVVDIVAQAQRLAILDNLANGIPVSSAEATASDNFVQAASGLSLLVYVVLVIAFLIWVHRVVANSTALGAQGLQFTPAWAVGWWFIPFASIVQPVRAIQETWRVTSTPRPSTPLTRGTAHRSWLVGIWWAAWLASGVAGWATAVTGTQTLTVLHDHTVSQIVANLLELIAAGLAVAVVLSLTGRQDRYAEPGYTIPS